MKERIFTVTFILALLLSPFRGVQAQSNLMQAAQFVGSWLNSEDVGVVIARCRDKYKSTYCPEKLNEQVSDSHHGGVWGWINSFSYKEGKSPASLCEPKIKTTLGDKYSLEEYERMLAQNSKTGYNYSLSEMHPHCVNQYDKTPDGKTKKEAMINNFYLGHNLLQMEQEKLLEGMAGVDAFLGNDYVAGINCRNLNSNKAGETCEEIKSCQKISKQQREKNIEDLSQQTLATYKEIKILSRELAGARGMDKAVFKKIKAKRKEFPWLEGKVFREKVKKLKLKGWVDSNDMKVAIKAQMRATNKKLREQFSKVTRTHGCISGTENDEICDDYEKTLVGLDSFGDIRKKLKPTLPAGKNYTEDQIKKYNDDSLAYERMSKAHCILKTRKDRDETVNEMATDIAIGVGLTAATLATGGLAGAAFAGARVAFVAGRAVMLAANVGYGTYQGAKAYNLCEEELNKLQAFKSQQATNACPSVADSQLYTINSSYDSCVTGAVAAMALGALPVVAGRLPKLMKRKYTGKTRTDTGVQLDTSKYFTADEVNVYYKFREGEKLLKKALKASGKERKALIKQAKKIKEEVGGVDLARYQRYKKDYIAPNAGRSGIFVDDSATLADFEAAILAQKKEAQRLLRLKKKQAKEQARLARDWDQQQIDRHGGYEVRWADELTEAELKSKIDDAIYLNKFGTPRPSATSAASKSTPDPKTLNGMKLTHDDGVFEYYNMDIPPN